MLTRDEQLCLQYRAESFRLLSLNTSRHAGFLQALYLVAHSRESAASQPDRSGGDATGDLSPTIRRRRLSEELKNCWCRWSSIREHNDPPDRWRNSPCINGPVTFPEVKTDAAILPS